MSDVQLSQARLFANSVRIYLQLAYADRKAVVDAVAILDTPQVIPSVHDAALETIRAILYPAKADPFESAIPAHDEKDC